MNVPANRFLALVEDDEAGKTPIISLEIECFLSGISDGRALLRALYGAIAEEPVPQRLLDIVRRAG